MKHSKEGRRISEVKQLCQESENSANPQFTLFGTDPLPAYTVKRERIRRRHNALSSKTYFSIYGAKPGIMHNTINSGNAEAF